MLQIIGLLVKLWPIIKPILPVLLKLIEENRGLLQGLSDRGETTHAEDARDFFKEMDKSKKWEPFKKDWE